MAASPNFNVLFSTGAKLCNRGEEVPDKQP